VSHYVFEPDGRTGRVKFTCIDHPNYEGGKQSRAYLYGCLGCRAVYAVHKATAKDLPGRDIPILRVEVRS
jgi:hypothetical protein